jgi:uncharacterized LabA/DUF88 family protein
MSKSTVIGIVDSGFLIKSMASVLKLPTGDVAIEGSELVDWFRVASARIGDRLLRCYWYDAVYPEGSKERHKQRAKLDKLEECAGMQLRLGHLQSTPFEHKALLKSAAAAAGIDYSELMKHFNPETRYTQKGVDTLIVLDMLRFVRLQACQKIILIGGDRDLAEAVREVQDMGCLVILAYPAGAPVAPELGNLADEKVAMSADLLRRFMSNRMDRMAALLKEMTGENSISHTGEAAL